MGHLFIQYCKFFPPYFQDPSQPFICHPPNTYNFESRTRKYNQPSKLRHRKIDVDMETPCHEVRSRSIMVLGTRGQDFLPKPSKYRDNHFWKFLSTTKSFCGAPFNSVLQIFPFLFSGSFKAIHLSPTNYVPILYRTHGRIIVKTETSQDRRKYKNPLTWSAVQFNNGSWDERARFFA